MRSCAGDGWFCGKIGHPVGHYWNYQPGALSLSQVTVTYNMREYQDSWPSNAGWRAPLSWWTHMSDNSQRVFEKSTSYFVRYPSLPCALFNVCVRHVSSAVYSVSTSSSTCRWRRVRPVHVALTHWGRDKMAAISQTIFSNAFSWMKIIKFRFKFH